MKLPAEARVQRLNDVLINASSPIKAKDLAEVIGVSKSAIFSGIRKMKELGIGIHPTKNGYVLSEFATKADDVGLLRRLNARRVSDMITIQAARQHIENRWYSAKDKVLLVDMITPLNINKDTLLKSHSIIEKLYITEK